MFRDIVAKSPLCADDDGYADDGQLDDEEEDLPRGRVEFNLKEIAHLARQADAQDKYPHSKNLALTGVVFHESRCGSTLVANSLIAMNPTHHRVYSESAPPLAALSLCGGGDGTCTETQGARIVRDVMYLMGRSDRLTEERYFFKIQSAGTKAISVFRKAFPTTPWLFVYRDPVQVMMSHFAHGERSANCLRSRQHPPRLLQQLAKRRGYQVAAQGNDDDDDKNDAEDLKRPMLSSEEFCAAHLATLTETAAEHIQQSHGLGRAVNYVTLPHILYETILPSWGVTVTNTEIANIQAISGKYSKARDNKKKQEWQEDSEKKEQMASPEIQDASRVFLQESFDLLEQLAQQKAVA